MCGILQCSVLKHSCPFFFLIPFRTNISCALILTHYSRMTYLHFVLSLAGLLKDPSLLMCHQISTRFHNRVAYDPGYQGMAYEVDEGRRLASLLGSKDVMMMCNHGTITTGRSVAMAFDLLYYLERACMFQVRLITNSQKFISRNHTRWIDQIFGDKLNNYNWNYHIHVCI